MATKYLSSSANLSVAVWWTTSGGSTITTAPSVGDDADLNGNTLTVDQTFTCDNIIGAGILSISGTRTINANLGNASSSFSCTFGSGATLNLNGNIVAASGSSRVSLSSATVSLHVVGNVTGGGVANLRGISQTNGTVTVVGNVTGGSATGAVGIRSSGGTFTITGTITGGTLTTAEGVEVAGGTGTLTGNVSAGTGIGATVTTSGSLTINGNVTGGSVSGSQGAAVNGAACVLAINGTVTGGTSTSSYGAVLSQGTLTITGSLVDGTGASAVVKTSASATRVFNYTPTNAQTATIGGKVMYPAPWNSGGSFGSFP